MRKNMRKICTLLLQNDIRNLCVSGPSGCQKPILGGVRAKAQFFGQITLFLSPEHIFFIILSTLKATLGLAYDPLWEPYLVTLAKYAQNMHKYAKICANMRFF